MKYIFAIPSLITAVVTSSKTGLPNIGNTCYLNSALKFIFETPTLNNTITTICTNNQFNFNDTQYDQINEKYKQIKEKIPLLPDFRQTLEAQRNALYDQLKSIEYIRVMNALCKISQVIFTNMSVTTELSLLTYSLNPLLYDDSRKKDQQESVEVVDALITLMNKYESTNTKLLFNDENDNKYTTDILILYPPNEKYIQDIDEPSSDIQEDLSEEPRDKISSIYYDGKLIQLNSIINFDTSADISIADRLVLEEETEDSVDIPIKFDMTHEYTLHELIINTEFRTNLNFVKPESTHVIININRKYLDHDNNYVRSPISVKIEDYIIFNNVNYSLHGLILHSGNERGGHYVSIVRDEHGSWISYDDMKVSTITYDVVKWFKDKISVLLYIDNNSINYKPVCPQNISDNLIKKEELELLRTNSGNKIRPGMFIILILSMIFF